MPWRPHCCPRPSPSQEVPLCFLLSEQLRFRFGDFLHVGPGVRTRVALLVAQWPSPGRRRCRVRKQSCDADQLALSGVGDKGENEWTVKKFPFAHLVIVGLPIKHQSYERK